MRLEEWTDASMCIYILWKKEQLCELRLERLRRPYAMQALRKRRVH